MLVLTRKQQERIHIGDNITITVVRIQGNAVRIGIEAPQEVHVVRGEIAVKDALAERKFAVVSAEAGMSGGNAAEGDVPTGAPRGEHVGGPAASRRRPLLAMPVPVVPAHAV
jgi:carbon storage regulator CsrA